MSTTPTSTGITAIATVGIPVTDQDRALAFYRDTLGFELRREFPMGPDVRWLEVAPAGALTTLALTKAGDGQPVGVDTGVRLQAVDAEAVHAALLAAGVDADAEILRWPGVPPMFTFRDADGNTVYVVEA